MGIEIIAALFGLFVFIFLRLMTTAPDGYEDETGFHFESDCTDKK